MRKREELGRLKVISGLRLETKLAALRRAATAREDTLTKLEEVARNVAAARAVELPDRGAALLHEAWAERRRRLLNMELARQNAEFEDLRAEASFTLGQDRTVDALRDRLREQTALRQRRAEQGGPG